MHLFDAYYIIYFTLSIVSDLLIDSIALDPLVPTCCWSNSDAADAALNTSDSLSVIQLSSAICGLACTVQFNQQDNNTVIRLIKQVNVDAHEHIYTNGCIIY